MNPRQLFFEGGEPAGRWACGKCGFDGHTDREQAERCCVCNYCGEPVDRKKYGAGYHHECQRASFERDRLRKLAAAELVEDYAGPVYVEGLGSSGYFEDMDDLLDYLCGSRGDRSWPQFANCCDVEPFEFDLDSALENEASDHHEDIVDCLNGIAELREAVDRFNAENAKVASWHVDEDRKVAVPSESEARSTRRRPEPVADYDGPES